MADPALARLRRQAVAPLRALIAQHLASRDRAALVYGGTVLFLLAAVSAALVAFAALAEDLVTGDPIVAWDQRFAAWLHAHPNEPTTDVLRVLTELGGVAFVTGATIVIAAGLALRRRLAEALLLVFAVLGSELVNFALKAIFRRERPSFPDPLATETSFSFPSGHSSVAIAFYGALAFVLARQLPRWRPRLAIALAAAAVIAAVGFSRLYLGVHYLSDVLAGFAAGLAWLLICVLALVIHARRRARAYVGGDRQINGG